jgi:hypothetical protein
VLNSVTQERMSQSQAALEHELLEATVYSADRTFSKLQVAQVAKSYQVPVELAEQVANALMQKQFGLDLEVVDFQSVVKQITDIENSVPDQGLRLWKLQSLARRSKRTYRELMECYNKALLNQQPVQTMSLKQLRDRTETETKWLIPGWLPQGTNLLFYGDGGTGKTLMAYQWLESIALGRPWNGYQVSQGRCLLVQCDEPEIVLRSRMDLLQLPDDAPLDIITDWSTDAIPKLRTYIEQQRPAFILIDSLSAVNKSCCFSENDMEYARPILQLTQLCSEFNVTICLIHHSNAMGQARGTRAIHNSVSEVWGLRPGESINERILTVQKTRLGRAPGSYKFLFGEDDYSFTYLGHADDPDGASVTQEEKIRLWLYQDGNRSIPYTPIEVAEQCGISQPSTRKALQELWAKGLISRRPSKYGKRGYVYYSPSISKADNDPAILTADRGIADKDRKPKPEQEGASAVSDPAIPQNCISNIKNSKKQGSQDRETPETIPSLENAAILACDPCTQKDRKNGIPDNKKQAEVTKPLQKGSPIEVLIEGKWRRGVLVRLRDQMHYSKRLRSLTHAVEVEVQGNRLIVSEDDVRPIDSQGVNNGQT